MSYPKTIKGTTPQEDRSWAVADALLEEIRSHPGGRVLNGEYDRCQAWLAEQGYSVTAALPVGLAGRCGRVPWL